MASICAGVAQTLLQLTLLRGGRRFRFPKRGKIARFRVGKGQSRIDFDLSPVVWSAGLLGFGLFGLSAIALFDCSPIISVLIALAADVGFVLILLYALRKLLASGDPMQGVSLLGATGIVSLTIPAHGVGSVSYVAEGKRHVTPARSADDLPLDQGARVMVIGLKNRVAIVEEF